MSVSAIPVTTHLVTEAARLAEEAGLPAANRKLGPQDFEMLRVVGQGAFGRVYQVRKRDTGEIFAMKVMRKDRIREKEHSGYVRAERDVLTAIDHPYVVALRYSFQTARKLYLVLDFINGGHLFFQLYKAGTFNELRARLYVAEIVCAVTHLHEIGVVHRDLKPENVLLDSEGHVKITDFGLAKPGMADDSARSNSFIGTLEYMAPEVISGSGHGKGVDWWAVGVLLYEMLCGLPPFRGKSRPALQRSITTTKPKLPHFLSREAAGLIRDLLHKDPELRLGRGANGGADVKRHAFFRTISWSALEQRLVPPPFRPVVSTLESVENFDKMWTDLPAQDSPCPTPRGESLTTLNSAHFAGFTYMPPSMMPHLERRTDSSD